MKSLENIQTVRVESWQEFDDFNMKSPQCVYRGQGNCEWSLFTGYERNRKVQSPMYEKEMLRRFISQASIYESNLPDRYDFVSWFSLMQHYGTGTRLLDVTRSKYIALFFALVGAINDKKVKKCAVWAFETYASNTAFYNAILATEPDGCIDTRDDPFASSLEEYKSLGWKFANKFIASDWDMQLSKIKVDDYVEQHKEKLSYFLKTGGVMEIVPKNQNKRMIAQAAEFLMPITLRKSFMDNLLVNEHGCAPRIVKLEIDKELHVKFWGKLKEMNISWQTLYPDIDGLAKNINW